MEARPKPFKAWENTSSYTIASIFISRLITKRWKLSTDSLLDLVHSSRQVEVEREKVL